MKAIIDIYFNSKKGSFRIRKEYLAFHFFFFLDGLKKLFDVILSKTCPFISLPIRNQSFHNSNSDSSLVLKVRI
jgi:hypothetical protein